MNEKEKKQLLKIARESIESAVKGIPDDQAPEDTFGPELQEKSGAFVTLRKHGRLKGCIGRIVSDIPLYKLVSEMAVSAATEDSRFSRLQPAELDGLEIEISVLSPMQKIDNPLDLELGVHGIYIRKGYSTGCFLPKVATDTGWTKEEFLSQCCSTKAGLSKDAWKKRDVDVYIFTSEIISEEDVGS